MGSSRALVISAVSENRVAGRRWRDGVDDSGRHDSVEAFDLVGSVLVDGLGGRDQGADRTSRTTAIRASGVRASRRDCSMRRARWRAITSGCSASSTSFRSETIPGFRGERLMQACGQQRLVYPRFHVSGE